jgi:hypothetical protein
MGVSTADCHCKGTTCQLSDYFWGVNAVVVNDFVQEYLFSLWDARQLVIRGQTASNGAGLHGRQATSTAQ